MIDILIGLAVVAAVATFWFFVNRPKTQAPIVATPLSTVVSQVSTGFDEMKASFQTELSKVPSLVSSEVVRLTADLEAMTQRALDAEQKLVAQEQAHQAALATVAQRVTAVINSSPELPPSPPAG